MREWINRCTHLPGILLFFCFVALRWYPLPGPAWDEIKARLAAVHADKERAYLAEKGYLYVDDGQPAAAGQ